VKLGVASSRERPATEAVGAATRAPAPLGPQLLEPEHPDTNHLEDVEAWISIYSELVKFDQNLLRRVARDESGSTQGHPSGRPSLQTLQEQLRGYRARLEFWYSRRWEIRGVIMDPEARTVTHRGHSVYLTPREFDLLAVLVQSPGQAQRPLRLIVQAWHDSALSNEQLRVYITRLRKKLHQIALADIVIQAGQGYLLIFRGPDSPSHPRGSAGSSV
jgi:hypothetical protein